MSSWNVLIDGLALGAPLGGAARYAQETWPRLARECTARGGHLHVLLAHRGEPALGSILPSETPEFTVHYATPSLLTRRDRWVRGSQAVRKVLEECAANGAPISLVQTQTAIPLFGLEEERFARVHLCHGLRAQWRAGWFARTAARLGLRKVLASSEAVLAVSQTLAGQLERLPSGRIFVASPGADHQTTATASPTSSPPQERPDLFWMGPAAEHKGLATLLQAFPSSGAGTRLHLHVRARELAPFEAQLAPLRERITLTEPIGKLESAAVFGAARAWVLPSELESFGMVVLEALASGIPMAVSDLPAHREVVGSAHEHVFWFAPGDAAACAQALRAALGSDPALGRSERMSRAREYTWQATVAATLEAWAHALALRGIEGTAQRRSL